MDIYKILETLKRVEESAPQLNEFLVKGGMPAREVLALNLFQDFDRKDGLSVRYNDFAQNPDWQAVAKQYAPIANALAQKVIALNRPLTDAEANAIDETWYDGSDAYDDVEVDYLVGIYDEQVDKIEALLAGNLTDDEFNEGIDSEHKYLVTYSNVNSGKTYTALVPADDEYEARDRINNAAGFGTRVQSVKPARGDEQTDQEWKIFKDPRGNGAGQAMLVDRGPVSKLSEDLQADDGEYYNNSEDFFGQFEADQFDEEKVSPNGMEVRGYINGVNVMVWRFKSDKKIGGWGVYDDSYLNSDMAEGYDPVESDYKHWEQVLQAYDQPSADYALELVVGRQGSESDWVSTIRNILTYVRKHREVLGKEVQAETGRTVKDAIMDIRTKFPQLYQAAQQPQGVAETSMTSAAKHSTGPKFTGYWKGTDKRTPGKHMVGAAESVEREISEGWNKYLAEFGADNTGGTAGMGQTAADKQKVAKELSNVTGAINKAKSTGVLPQGLGTTQAAQSIMQDPADVNSATTAQKKELGAAGDSFNDFIKAASTTPGGQSQLNTVLAAMKKLKSTPGA